MSQAVATWHLRVPDWALSHLDVWLEGGLTASSGAIRRYQPPDFASLANELQGDPRLILWLPPSSVLELTANVPVMPAHQLRQRVPYAVEESLIGDVDTQHFALGTAERLPSGPLSVPLRIVDTAQFGALLQRFKDLTGLTPDAVYSEADALPAKPGDIQLWIEGGEIRLRHPDGRWLMTSADELPAALGWMTQGTSELGLWVVVARAERAQWESRLDAEASRFSAVRWQVTDGSPLGACARRIFEGSPVNLLQGEWAISEGRRSSREWRWPMTLAAVILLLLVSLDVVTSSRATEFEQGLDSALTDWRRELNQGADRAAHEPVTLLSQGLSRAVALQRRWPEGQVRHIEAHSETMVIELSGALDAPPDADDGSTVVPTESGWRWTWSTTP